MSTSLAQVFSEARSLVTRLHDREKAADGMVGQAHTLSEKINCMKEYKEDLHELNDVTHQKPRTALVHSLQQENRQIRLLQEENRQLKLALEDHQAALELIMQRYRQQMLRIMQLTKMQTLAEKAALGSESTNFECAEGVRQYHEFGRVFDSCLKLGEESSHHDQMEIARLRTENSGLRKIIDAAGKNEVWAKQANLLQAFVKAAAEDFFAGVSEGNKPKRDEFLRDHDENRTPTADRSPEDSEPSGSLPLEEEKTETTPSPSPSTTTTASKEKIPSASTDSKPTSGPKSERKPSAGTSKAKSPIKALPVGAAGRTASTGASGKAGTGKAGKSPLKSGSKPNGNNNITSVGNANATGSSPGKKSPATTKTSPSASASMKRSSSSGSNQPVSSVT